MKAVFYIIKFILLVIITAWLSVVMAQTNAEIKVDLEISNKPLKEVFTALEQKSDLHFVYNDALVSSYTGISVSSKNRTVASILTEVLGKTNLKFIKQVNKIIIEKKDVLPSASPAIQNEPVRAEVITGIVVEEGNDRPIRNASVYFDGTLNGTTTDSTGNFTLDLRSGSKIKISVTAVGFYPGSASEYIPGTKLIIRLKPRNYELAAVEIMADDGLSRKEKLKLFKKEFLGDDDNAWNCDILNEDDIRVTYNIRKNILKAYCDNPIQIRNKNLGYLLSFTLESFLSSDDGTFFTGTQFFKEDVSPMDLKKIEKARKATYLGSRMHFIRSLWNNDLKKNNFRVNRALGYQMYYEDMVVEHDNQKYLNPTETLEIIYRWNKSQLFRNTLGKEIYIDKNGYNNPAGVNWAGAIGDERVGDSLPLEYGLPASSSGTVSAIAASAGTGGSTEPAVSFSAPIDTLRSRMPIEKLYIQFDKPYYNSGDTLRMKAYLFDAALIRGSVNSGIVYLELANDSNQIVLRRMLPMGYGLGTGSIALNKSEVPEGGYTLRAYTSLMRNFGESQVFEKQLYISSASQNILVSSTSELSKKSGKDNLQLALGFNELNRKAIGLREIDLRVQEGKKILFRDKVRTDVEGKMDINFAIPEKTAAKAVSIIAGDGKDLPVLTIPIALNRPENTDLQFMPEGGNLVAGIPSRVGFKAIGEDGNAVDVSGKIYNEKNVEVAAFKSSYKGMGSFELTPQNEEYTAKLFFNDGTTKAFTLPAVKTTGTVIRVSNSPKDEWITVTVHKSPGISQQARYYLLGQSRGMINYEELVQFDGFTVSEEKIPKNLFPTGIVRFTLMSADRHPLNERITFVDHHDNLHINITPDQETHPARDSVALAIQVTDDSGNPVQGTFSMAVTDDNQVKNDSLGNNILTSVLLTSGLKGTVEDPGHYFQETAQAGADLDHLLLTQGWTGYDWKDVFNPPESLAYPPEFEFKIRGKVSASNKKDLATVQLLSSKPSFFMADTAEADGSFGFSGFPAAESLHFFLQAKNAKKRNLELEVDAYQPPVFKPVGERLKPWYVNSDTALIRQAVTQSVQQVELVSKGSNVLEKVTITDKKIVPGSRNLNGPGESDQTLNEKDMALMGKKTLLDVMKEKITGFNVGVFPTTQPQRSGLVSVNSGLPRPKGDDGDITGNTAGEILVKKQSYRIGEKELHLVIDGVDVEQFYIPDAGPEKSLPPWTKGNPPPGHVNVDYISLRNEASLTDRMQFVKSYLTTIKAEDIKGIEVMVNPRYNSRYKSLFSSKILVNLDMTTTDFAFIEVTTRSGNGAFMNKMPGVVYNPVPFTSSAAFYRPKYSSKASPFPDLRSTIHWEPDILTDKEGKATVSFYSADKPGTYSIILEGSNMNGNVGRKLRTIQIK